MVVGVWEVREEEIKEGTGIEDIYRRMKGEVCSICKVRKKRTE